VTENPCPFFMAGYRAFQHETESRQLVYNPHEFGHEHDQWDSGYQAALDEITTKTQSNQNCD
jgi:hypothetical protein